MAGNGARSPWARNDGQRAFLRHRRRAWASQNRADLLPGVGQFNAWKNASGWTAGGGAEFLVNPHWTVKTEALWVDLNSVSYAGGISPSGGIFAAGHMDVNFFVFRGGVTTSSDRNPRSATLYPLSYGALDGV